MAKVEQPIYCITEQQRNALLKYLLDRPYKEVAIAVQFLTNAPSAFVNVEVPDELETAESKLEEEKEHNSHNKQEEIIDKSPVLAQV
ncbi:hypothetical protein NIES4102_38100 [Chondrocystis sp. NIES-4102]|nr:hypothetical protein NIES4102_38100 [Chondrocystis sp. NIES-4102]